MSGQAVPFSLFVVRYVSIFIFSIALAYLVAIAVAAEYPINCAKFTTHFDTLYGSRVPDKGWRYFLHSLFILFVIMLIAFASRYRYRCFYAPSAY